MMVTVRSPTCSCAHSITGSPSNLQPGQSERTASKNATVLCRVICIPRHECRLKPNARLGFFLAMDVQRLEFRSDAAKWRGDMDDMVAFITGGGSGIGQTAAKLLARRGARVSLAGRTQDQLAELAEAIGGAGGTAITVTCDVSDEDSVRSAAASGQLPFVITNIGPNLLTLTGTASGEVNPTVPQWSSRTIASNGTILYFT
jgi:FlaA1/EpsC-like NDP-sugar epimerase